MTLRFSIHKSPFFRVPNIFPSYTGPPSIPQDLALALPEPSPENWPLLEPTPEQARVGCFQGFFVKSLNFYQIFFCKLFLKFVKTKKSTPHNTQSMHTAHAHKTNVRKRTHWDFPVEPKCKSKVSCLHKGVLWSTELTFYSARYWSVLLVNCGVKECLFFFKRNKVVILPSVLSFYWFFCCWCFFVHLLMYLVYYIKQY